MDLINWFGQFILKREQRDLPGFSGLSRDNVSVMEGDGRSRHESDRILTATETLARSNIRCFPVARRAPGIYRRLARPGR